MNHPFQTRSFLTHLLLLSFYQHCLFADIEDKHNNLNSEKLFERFQKLRYDSEMLNMLCEPLLGDLNEPGFYSMVEKYKYINGFHPFKLTADLIYLTILARNDDLLFMYDLRNFKDSFDKLIEIFDYIDDIVKVVSMIISAVNLRMKNKTFEPKQLALIRAILPTHVKNNSIEISVDELEKFITKQLWIRNR